jgi:hypothetical protein
MRRSWVKPFLVPVHGQGHMRIGVGGVHAKTSRARAQDTTDGRGTSRLGSNLRIGLLVDQSRSRWPAFFSSQKYISEDLFDFGHSKNTLGMLKMVMWHTN